MNKYNRYPKDYFSDYGETGISKTKDSFKTMGLNRNRKTSFSSEWFDDENRSIDDYERGISAQVHLMSSHNHFNQMVYTFEEYDYTYHEVEEGEWMYSALRDLLLGDDL